MPTAPARMPLRTAQDAPCFRGAMDDLFRYIAEVESLCRKCQRATNDELIKWAVYYADESAWDVFALTRELLEEPKNWEDFKAAMGELYLQHESACTHAPLPAPCPPAAVPTTDLPVAAFTLDPAALHAPPLSLSPAAADPQLLSQLPAPSPLPAIAPLLPVQVRLLHAPASSLLPTTPITPPSLQLPAPATDLPVKAVMSGPAAPRALFTSPMPALPDPLLPPTAPISQAPHASATLPSLPAESALSPTPAPPVPQPALVTPTPLTTTPLPRTPLAAIAALAPLRPHPPAPSILPIVLATPFLLTQVQAPS
ncbi:hypothetical protein AX14_008702, partial [Amanita brunnescens Koide BX004]